MSHVTYHLCLDLRCSCGKHVVMGSVCRNVCGNVISYSASLGLSFMYCDMYHMCIVWFVEVRFLVFSSTASWLVCYTHVFPYHM